MEHHHGLRESEDRFELRMQGLVVRISSIAVSQRISRLDVGRAMRRWNF